MERLKRKMIKAVSVAVLVAMCTVSAVSTPVYASEPESEGAISTQSSNAGQSVAKTRKAMEQATIQAVQQKVEADTQSQGILKARPINQVGPSYEDALEYDGLDADYYANCVSFANYMVGNTIPLGMWSLEDKMAIMNGDTPKVGAIAVTKGTSSYGHMAYVEAVDGDTITTLNGGFSGGHIVRVIGTAEEQEIVGYWYPEGLQ